MKPARKQRLALLLFVVFGAGAALGLALAALDQNINLYFSPAQMQSGAAPVGVPLRGGGLVVAGSVKRQPDSLKVTFEVTDGAGTVPVVYEGILPDLFREGQGIVATGTLDKTGVLHAEQVLAKHDETYMPPEVKEALDAAGVDHTKRSAVAQPGAGQTAVHAHAGVSP